MTRQSCVYLLTVVLIAPALLVNVNCRGYSSENPPIHVNPNMDTQEKGRPYRESDFFADGQYMREPISGTIARGQLKEDEHFYFGTIHGEPAKSFPTQLVMDENFIKRGQQIFNRACAACHSQIGDGGGLVGKRLLVKPLSLHSEYMYGMPPGHYFNVIRNGIRTMQGNGHILSEQDTWATTAYIRALQMSQDMDGEWIKRSALWWMQK